MSYKKRQKQKSSSTIYKYFEKWKLSEILTMSSRREFRDNSYGFIEIFVI